MVWNRIERGAGRPLILLHGIGSACEIWEPVMGMLAADRRVIAFDLPGHGSSPAPRPGEPLGPRHFAKQLGEQLHELGVDGPVDLVGNSLGGWTALEAAKLGLARSVVGLSPAGLWHGPGPTSSVTGFRIFRSMVRRYPHIVRALLQSAAGRTVLLPMILGRPWRMPAPVAVESVRMFDQTTILDDLFAASQNDQFAGGDVIDVPVTIAFGTRDWLLNRRTSQFSDQLPTSARWIELKGCGHVPMWDDPELVARTVLEGTS
jgi:pimeloyl-ACP methyl ester carboxylesterase